jgi:hypothetical protein
MEEEEEESDNQNSFLSVYYATGLVSLISDTNVYRTNERN